MHVWALGLQTCTFQGPGASKTPPKFHEETPKRGKKERKLWRKKKARNFGPPTLRGPPFGPPPFGERAQRGPPSASSEWRDPGPSKEAPGEKRGSANPIEPRVHQKTRTILIVPPLSLSPCLFFFAFSHLDSFFLLVLCGWAKRLEHPFGPKSAWTKSATHILAKVGQMFLAKFGLAKCGQIRMAKSGLAKYGRDPTPSSLSPDVLV